MQALSAYTRDGMVFPVDARLRPRGREGELLISPCQLSAYFEQEAQAWEALMYTKLRFLAGSRELGEQSALATKILFRRFAADCGFVTAVREMRRKLEAADAPEHSFKSSPGGIYDIDFLSSFLLVKGNLPNKQGTLRDRLWRCAFNGLMNRADCAALDHAAELFRTAEHVARLVVGRARKWLPATEHAREVTERLCAQILQRDFPNGLEAELLQTEAKVRGIYDRLSGS
jgi:glutamine synthetase adenylyltransferase